VGDNTRKGGLSNSKVRWEGLMEKYLIPAKENKIPIIIEVYANYSSNN
jgi:hypothetical protein